MLESLHIENIAVISKTDIDFSKGFNVLTGETGAGKSILIDSINLILGGRASKDIIRTGENTAFVSAVFSNVDHNTSAFLSDYGIIPEDGNIIISRSISADGKSVCRINDRPVSSSTLRQCAACLVDIHGQHDSKLLMLPERHIDYIDSIGHTEEYLNDYKDKYKSYTEIDERIKSIKQTILDKEHKIDLLSYQRNEILSADIKIGEEEALNERKKIVLNKQRIISAVTSVQQKLRDDENNNAIDSIYYSKQEIEGIASSSSVANEIAGALNDLYYTLQDISDKVDNLLSTVDNDDNIDIIEDRLNTIYNMKRKYGDSEEAVIRYLDKIEKELNDISCSDQLLTDLEKEKEKYYRLLVDSARILSDKREKAANVFAEEVKKQMAFLDMPYVEFLPNITPCDYFSGGAETCEFLISVNPGEPPKPIIKIASGGELSRIMLAIKTALAENDDIPTIVFDEIDSGISGRAADKVALKMKEVSRRRQVFAVTHLAQIAVYSDNHCLVEKTVLDGSTYTTVKPLDFDGRVDEIARIIGGSMITETTKNSAREMILQAQKGE